MDQIKLSEQDMTLTPKEMFDKIVAISNSGREILESIYDFDHLMFHPQTINNLIIIGESTQLTFLDIITFQFINDLSLFREFAQTEDQTKLNKLLLIFDIYFEPICRYAKNRSYVTIKTRVLGYLKTSIVSSTLAGLHIKGTITTKMATIPKLNMISNPADIEMFGQNQHLEIINSPEQTFTYLPQTTPVSFKGSLLTLIAENIINYSNFIKVENENYGIAGTHFVPIQNFQSLPDNIV